MASQKYATAYSLSHRRDFILKPLTVTCSPCGPRRAIGAVLTEWKVEARYRKPRAGHDIREGNQQRSIGVASGAMGQYKTILFWVLRNL